LRVRIHVHLVFVTKYRRKVFDGDALQRLQAIFEKVCRDFQAELVEMNGEAEHAHLLIHYPPKHSVSSLVNSLNYPVAYSVSDALTWRNAIGTMFLWSPSYFTASCGGAPLSSIKQYVEQQRPALTGLISPA
jgi:putative transposase